MSVGVQPFKFIIMGGYMNLHYFFDRLEHNRKVFIPFIIQMVIVFLLLPDSLLTSFNTISGISKLKKLEINSAYILEDYTTASALSELLRNEEEGIKRYNALYGRLKEQNKRGYGVVQSNITAEALGVSYSPVCTNESFFGINSIRLSQGSFFDGESGDMIRVVLGGAFEKKAEIGAKYLFNDTGGKPVEMVVTGILASGTEYPRKDDPKTTINADNCIFINISDLIACGQADVPTFDMYFFNYIVLDESEETVHEVWEIFDDSHTKTVFPRKYNDFLEDYSESGRQVLGFQLICALTIVAFSIVNLISCIYVMIERSLKEYAINIMCGARRMDIFYLFAAQFVFVMVWPVLLNLCIFKELKLLAVSLLLAVIISLICLSVPFYKIRRLPLSSLLRRCE